VQSGGNSPRAALSFVLFVFFGFLVGCGAGNQSNILRVAAYTTKNPLVASVAMTSLCEGQAMVEFGPDTSYGRTTSWFPVSQSRPTTSILVAGMRASTTYHMQAHVQCPAENASSGDFTFTTGALPANHPFPTLVVTRPNASLSALENPGIELISAIVNNSSVIQSFFADRDGHPIWYYDVGTNNVPFPMKLLPNGHVLIVVAYPTTTKLREVNLAGDTVREMDVTVLAQKAAAAGFDFSPINFHHDVLPLANGHLIVLVGFTKAFNDLPGYPGTTQVIGDGLIDLDENWDPVWAWNSFDYLDVNRHLSGLPDWTHANAIEYLPNDGNLLLSMRHQSWVLKIDYSNGAGSGNVLWRLGYQGDFTLAQGTDPSLWFSFQHFPKLVSQNGPQMTLTIWDNGDSRPLDSSGTTCQFPGPPFCYSRATIFQVDESTGVASLQWADPLNLFSLWGGSISQLGNGNVEFDANGLSPEPVPNLASEVQEVTQTSPPQIVWKMDFMPTSMNAYRAYRVPSLYPGVTWKY
jgi:arylsulfate sulfotransferase